MVFGRMFLFGGRVGDPKLDSYPVPFDKIGIDVGKFRSSLCCPGLRDATLGLLLPSVAFAQIAVRAQLPLLISIKNNFSGLQKNSGYHVFIGIASVLYVLALGLVVVAVFLPTAASIIIAILVIVWACLAIMLGAMRTDFRVKYHISGELGPDETHGGLNGILDPVLCAVPVIQALVLAQMLDHVMPAKRRLEKESCCCGWLGDPSRLPPRDGLHDTDIGNRVNEFDGAHGGGLGFGFGGGRMGGHAHGGGVATAVGSLA